MEKDPKKDQAFQDAFSDLLNSSEKKEDSLFNEDPPQQSLEEALNGNEPHAKDSIHYMEPGSLTEKHFDSMIYDHIEDQDLEEQTSRPPLPVMSPAQEMAAVSSGLGELRKMREFIGISYRHIDNEFLKLYPTYPLIQKFFTKEYNRMYSDVSQLISDMETLIAGDIDNLQAVKKDYRLYQRFEQKRMQVLYDIYLYYHTK